MRRQQIRTRIEGGAAAITNRVFVENFSRKPVPARLLVRAFPDGGGPEVARAEMNVMLRPGAQEETAFERGRKRALDLVERGLHQGDGVSVVLASDPPRALIRKPSLDLKAVLALLTCAVVAGVAVGFTHRLQVKRNAVAFLAQADQAEAEGDEPRGEPARREVFSTAARPNIIPAGTRRRPPRRRR